MTYWAAVSVDVVTALMLTHLVGMIWFGGYAAGALAATKDPSIQDPVIAGDSWLSLYAICLVAVLWPFFFLMGAGRRVKHSGSDKDGGVS